MPGADYAAGKTPGTHASDLGHEPTVMHVLESELSHPVHDDGLVNKGDPVIFGELQIPGVAMEDAKSSSDMIVVQLEGIVNFNVSAVNDLDAAIAINKYDAVYLDDGVLNRDNVNGALYGYAIQPVSAGLVKTIPVFILRA